MKSIKFPVTFTFRITTLSNDFRAEDADGRVIAYVRQKMFRLREKIDIYNDTDKTNLNYRIQTSSWLDFNAAYKFTDRNDQNLGKIVRKGMRSFWKATYELVDQHDQLQFHLEEDNAWVKVLDSMVGEIPVIGAFTGYFMNPAYNVTNLNGVCVARLTKQKSFFGRRFTVEKLAEIDQDDQERILLGLFMLVLLERCRG